MPDGFGAARALAFTSRLDLTLSEEHVVDRKAQSDIIEEAPYRNP